MGNWVRHSEQNDGDSLGDNDQLREPEVCDRPMYGESGSEPRVGL